MCKTRAIKRSNSCNQVQIPVFEHLNTLGNINQIFQTLLCRIFYLVLFNIP